MKTAIIGLGNPGKQYEQTRHNAGFLCVDALAEALDAPWAADGDAAVAEAKELILVKPLTFMNASGAAVGRIVRFQKIPLPRVWVVHDDVDLPFGVLRIQFGSRAAGHKGVESVIEHIGSKDFWRFRIGVGRPVFPADGPDGPPLTIEDFVLQPFTPEEQKTMDEVIGKTVAALQIALRDGIETSAKTFSE